MPAFRILTLLLAAAILVIAAPARAAERVTIERDGALLAEPRADAAQVAQLRQGMSAEVIGKNGVWLNLRTAEGSGWTFSFNVRFPSQAAAADGGSGGSFLGRLFAPRRNSVAGTSTIGIRGLDEADLRQASFNAGQMQLLDQYSADREAAQAHASAGGLVPARVDYLGGATQ